MNLDQITKDTINKKVYDVEGVKELVRNYVQLLKQWEIEMEKKSDAYINELREEFKNIFENNYKIENSQSTCMSTTTYYTTAELKDIKFWFSTSKNKYTANILNAVSLSMIKEGKQQFQYVIQIYWDGPYKSLSVGEMKLKGYQWGVVRFNESRSVDELIKYFSEVNDPEEIKTISMAIQANIDIVKTNINNIGEFKVYGQIFSLWKGQQQLWKDEQQIAGEERTSGKITSIKELIEYV